MDKHLVEFEPLFSKSSETFHCCCSSCRCCLWFGVAHAVQKVVKSVQFTMVVQGRLMQGYRLAMRRMPVKLRDVIQVQKDPRGCIQFTKGRCTPLFTKGNM